MGRSLIQLREEKQRLLGLAKKKRRARKIKERAIREERKLKREIRALKTETARNISRRIVKVAKSPRTKSILKRAKKGFLKFAENLEKADI